MYEVKNSLYTYPNSDVLKNKLDIQDEKRLKAYETKMVAFKLATIVEKKFQELMMKII